MKTTATTARRRLAADEAIIGLGKSENREDENGGENSKLGMKSRRAIWTLGLSDELVQINGYCEIN
ncbi:hypothetical protein IEQ34_026630 [Dendrobium chrysotoxum]|uniref:Uncharacterized protein n=1 Tax=Dendrobium chrysotoxum TaxID=161865 RepID=A0AAV7FLY5_DENCH|nr:hypothetical protein IEQ34_026630 [Dendrobium chrysotoxum]